MTATRALAALTLAVALITACGDDSSTDDTEAPVTEVTTAPPPATEPATTVTPVTEPEETTTVTPTTEPGATTTTPPVTEPEVTTTAPATLEQPAIWPAADVVFATPEEAAADFVAQALGEGPVLGEFMAGDSRSGEMELFAGDETGQPLPNARSVLFLRQLGPSDGWFVIGAGSDNASIASPETGATVPAGEVTVEGEATGFEANVGLRAFLAGDASVVFDETSTMAGNFGDVLPYSATLDLSGAQPGDVVVVLVHGGVGLETDPGDMSAIPVIVG